MKKIVFSKHSLIQCEERGAKLDEVEATINDGSVENAKKNRIKFTMNFQYNAEWGGKYYPIKQIEAIAVEENNELIVITVIAKYF